MTDPLTWIDDEANAWRDRGLNRRLVTLGGSGPGRVVLEGLPFVNFGSNDYLGLAGDPRVIEAAVEASRVYGWGSGASPLVSGWFEPHERLAASLARFEGVEAVALFPSGFAANLGTIGALVGPEDAVYLDRLDHACLVDGARLSRARLRVYPHNDMNRLESILSRDRGKFRRSMIATDGVFSMDGDVAALADLADLAERYDAILLVDEAHGTGVFGETGRGASELCGVHDRIPVKVGTLSKALGSVGGFVAGSRRLVDWLINHARPLVYSTSLPPAAAAAANRALEILQAEPWRRSHLMELASKLREGISVVSGGATRPPHPNPPPQGGRGPETVSRTLASDSLPPCGGGLGWGVEDIAPPDNSSTPLRDGLTGADSRGFGPIVPLIVGTPERAVDRASKLRDRGFLVPAIRPPTVPEGTARLRISLSASHELADVDRLIAALYEP
jgi:8-amino-7-oxononanoate synthase